MNNKYDFFINDTEVTKWILQKIEDISGSDLHVASNIGVIKNKKPIAGVIYTDYRKMEHGDDIRVIIRGRTGYPWAKPEILRPFFAYPFVQLGCARITAVIRDGNKASQKFCTSLGFRKEGTLRRGYNGSTNAILYGMLKDECRYLVNG